MAKITQHFLPSRVRKSSAPKACFPLRLLREPGWAPSGRTAAVSEDGHSQTQRLPLRSHSTSTPLSSILTTAQDTVQAESGPKGPRAVPRPVTL